MEGRRVASFVLLMLSLGLAFVVLVFCWIALESVLD